MSDPRKDFEIWYSGAFSTKPKFTMVSPNHYKDDDVDAAYWSWKACQKVNDARITSLESHNRELLAVIAAKDEALLKIHNGAETRLHAQMIADEALAIKLGDIALIKVGYASEPSIQNLINGNDVIVGKKNDIRTKTVYTIQTKRNTE